MHGIKGPVLALFLVVSPAALATLQMDPAAAPADVARLNELIRKCEGESRAFREMMEAIRRAPGAVPANPGRNQPGIAGDRFGPPWEIDLADIERFPNPRFDEETRTWVFPPGMDSRTTTLCQILGHAFWERFHSLYAGNDYFRNHTSALDFETAIRKDFGQGGEPTNHTGVDDHAETTYWDSNGAHFVEDWTVTVTTGGSVDIGPGGVRDGRVICRANCAAVGGAPPRAVRTAAATCDACQRRLEDICRPAPLDGFACTRFTR